MSVEKKVQHIILQQSVQTAEDIYAQERNCFHNTHDSAETLQIGCLRKKVAEMDTFQWIILPVEKRETSQATWESIGQATASGKLMKAQKKSYKRCS